MQSANNLVDHLRKRNQDLLAKKGTKFDDSYEAIMRIEFEMMRYKFEDIVKQLKNDIEN